MASKPIPALRRISITLGTAARQAAWSALGFTVERHPDHPSSNIVRFRNFEIELLNANSTSDDRKPKISSWCWTSLQQQPQTDTSSTSFCGLQLQPNVAIDSQRNNNIDVNFHCNGVTSVDHVVLKTTDCDQLVMELEHAGLEVARSRTDIYPGIRQVFIRTGQAAGSTEKGLFLEIVGPDPNFDKDTDSDTPPNFLKVSPRQSDDKTPHETQLWGLGLTSPDLQKTFSAATPLCSKIRKAVQPNKHILTLKPKTKLGIAVAVLSDGRNAEQLNSRL